MAADIPRSHLRDQAHIAIAGSYAAIDHIAQAREVVDEIEPGVSHIEGLAAIAARSDFETVWHDARQQTRRLKDRGERAEALAVLTQYGGEPDFDQAREQLAKIRPESIFSKATILDKFAAHVAVGQRGDEVSWGTALEIFELFRPEYKADFALKNVVKTGRVDLLDIVLDEAQGADRAIRWPQDRELIMSAAATYLADKKIRNGSTLLNALRPNGIVETAFDAKTVTSIVNANQPIDAMYTFKKSGFDGLAKLIRKAQAEDNVRLRARKQARLVSGLSELALWDELDAYALKPQLKANKPTGTQRLTQGVRRLWTDRRS